MVLLEGSGTINPPVNHETGPTCTVDSHVLLQGAADCRGIDGVASTCGLEARIGTARSILRIGQTVRSRRRYFKTEARDG
jgi:hypothetical protein